MNLPAAPEVSVLMTTFNVAEFVADALRSALAQTLRSIEIVIVDDGSTDATVEVIQSFDDPRIRLYQRPHAGQSCALNAAVDVARGEFVATLDGDDMWHPDKLALQVACMRNDPNVDLTFSWYRVIDGAGSDTGLTSRKWRGPISFRQLLIDNVIGNGSSAVIRRQAFLKIGKFDESVDSYLDYDAALRVALLGPGKLACVPAYLTYYRRRAGQNTKDLSKLERGYNQLLEKMGVLAPEETPRFAARARSHMSRFFAFVAYENGDFAQAYRYLSRGFLQAPFTFVFEFRNWKLAVANTAAALLPKRVYSRLLRAVLRAR